MIKKIKIIIIVLVSGLFISSCSIIDLFRTGGILLVNIRAEDNINPTINNQPAPVTLRIYQLKDNVIFDERNFIELYHQDDDLLKNDLLSKRIIPSIYPSSEKEITLPLIEGTQHIAIIVEFSSYRSSANKKRVRLYSSKGARVAIHLDGTIVSIKINGERMDNLLSVIWQEGMFLNPQHFQQNTRYLESYCREVIKQSFPEYYGVSELIIDDSLHHIGKIQVIAAKGIFPDRTPFILNHAITLDLMPEDSGKIIYLAIHLEDIKKQQISTTQEFRYIKVEENIIDNNRVEREYCNIELAKLNVF